MSVCVVFISAPSKVAKVTFAPGIPVVSGGAGVVTVSVNVPSISTFSNSCQFLRFFFSKRPFAVNPASSSSTYSYTFSHTL